MSSREKIEDLLLKALVAAKQLDLSQAEIFTKEALGLIKKVQE